jgi:hypothetical protein
VKGSSSRLGDARGISTPASGAWTRKKLLRLLVATGVVAVLASAPGALARCAGYQPAFRRPGASVYCQLGFTNVLHLRCLRPKDGFWIELSAPGRSARVTKGYDPGLRGFHKRGFQLLGFGRVWVVERRGDLHLLEPPYGVDVQAGARRIGSIVPAASACCNPAARSPGDADASTRTSPSSAPQAMGRRCSYARTPRHG